MFDGWQGCACDLGAFAGCRHIRALDDDVRRHDTGADDTGASHDDPGRDNDGAD